MADSPLRECWHKLGRAKEHRGLLYEEIAEFLKKKPYAVVPEYDGKQFKHLFRLKVLKPIPQERWALMIGDCIHNARAALDYIAWRLAGSDLADRDTLFPIYDTAAKFDSSLWRLKNRLHPDAIAEIRRHQPYNRENPHSGILWVLQELDARDKHKLLTMTQTMNYFASIGAESTDDARNYITTFRESPLQHNAVIAEIACPVGTVESHVKVDGKFEFGIAFEKGIVAPDGIYPVSEVLWNIHRTVSGLISDFERLIASNPHWIP